MTIPIPVAIPRERGYKSAILPVHILDMVEPDSGEKSRISIGFRIASCGYLIINTTLTVPSELTRWLWKTYAYSTLRSSQLF